MSESVTDPLHSATEQIEHLVCVPWGQGRSAQHTAQWAQELAEALGVTPECPTGGPPASGLSDRSESVFDPAGDHDLRHGCLDAPIGDLGWSAVVSCSWYPPARS